MNSPYSLGLHISLPKRQEVTVMDNDTTKYNRWNTTKHEMTAYFLGVLQMKQEIDISFLKISLPQI